MNKCLSGSENGEENVTLSNLDYVGVQFSIPVALSYS